VVVDGSVAADIKGSVCMERRAAYVSVSVVRE
jgi:hypothetical protein